jgi:transposase
MTLDLSKVKIFVRPGSTDLRKAVNGLSCIVQEEMREKPLSGNLFLFCNKGRKLLKGILVGQVSCKQHGILAVQEAAGAGEVAVA